MLTKDSAFYLGGLSCGGYRNYFDEFVREYRMPVLIEGGFSSGAGKILRAVDSAFADGGFPLTRICCASGVSRLDAVGCDEAGLCFVNASEPHAPRAALPAAVEQVLPLYDAYDARVLSEQRNVLEELSQCAAASSRRAGRYITAAAGLLRESESAVAVCTDLDKARRFAGALSRRYLPWRGGAGKQRIRLLSAVTADGLSFLRKTLCGVETLVVLEDEFGAASNCILQTLRDEALEKGHTFIACPCAVRPRHLEHLIFPELNTAFVTANRSHGGYEGNPRQIHCTRFSDKSGIRARRARIRFNRKTAQDLLEQAYSALEEARQQQARIDAVYAGAELPERMEALCCRAAELAREGMGL